MKRKITFLLLVSVLYFGYAQKDLVKETIDFEISPNPSSHYFNIVLKDVNKDAKVEIFDVLGKKIYNTELNKIKNTVDVSHWRSGFYLVRFISSGKVKTKRFLKK